MATMPEMNPASGPTSPHDRPRSKEELHRDRVALIVALLFFAAMITLVILGAIWGPSDGSHFDIPMMP